MDPKRIELSTVSLQGSPASLGTCEPIVVSILIGRIQRPTTPGYGKQFFVGILILFIGNIVKLLYVFLYVIITIPFWISLSTLTGTGKSDIPVLVRSQAIPPLLLS